MGKSKKLNLNRRKKREKSRDLKKHGLPLIGIVDLTKKGHAYIISELSEDVFISRDNIRYALNGDKVKILYNRNKKNKLEGEIIEIIEFGNRDFVGVIEFVDNYAFVRCDNRNMPYDIYISERKLSKVDVQDGQKVFVNIIDFSKGKNPIGRIINVLGFPGDNDTEMNSIMLEFDLPIDFPDDVLDTANNIIGEINNEEIKKRRDFRNITTFTIDPYNAKDFDDALSVRKLDNNLYEIGIHIADVSYYVEEDSILDKEAINRATSVYLVDRVIPMLPERLSNGICSLRPNEDKLCFSVVFHITDKVEIKKQWFGRTIINSDRRFTYEEVQSIIDGVNGDFNDDILLLDMLAKKLRAKRFSGKSIAFNRIEPKFNLDDNGKPIDLFFRESNDANKLIEEFMLLANKKVAERIGKVKKGEKIKTFVYRNHDLPNQEKLESLSEFIDNFNYELDLDENKIAKSLNNLMKEIKGQPEENVIENLAIRTMSKATYSTNNIGHYGLDFDFYTHFTSPIRRYPDVLVHRLLDKYLSGGKSENKTKYEDLCKISSEQEKKAARAERESIKYKQVEFMLDKVGESYYGVITSITDWGIYVELEDFMIEGMIRISDVNGDFVFDKKEYCLVSEDDKYQIGDRLQVNVDSAILNNKQLNFSIN